MKLNKLLSLPLIGILFLMGCNTDDLVFDNLYYEDPSPTYALQIGFGDYSIGTLLEELDGDDFEIDSTSGSVVELHFPLDSSFVTKEQVLNDTDIIDIVPDTEDKVLTPFSTIDLSSVGGTLTNNTGSPASIFTLADNAGISFTSNDLTDTLEIEYIADKGSILSHLYYLEGYFIFQISGFNTEYTLTALNTFESTTDNPMVVSTPRNEADQIELEGFYNDFEIPRDPTDILDDSLNFVQYRLNITDLTLDPGEFITNNSVLTVDIETGSLDIRSFEAVRGQFKEQAFDIDPEIIDFNAFSDFSSGTISFDDPQIIFGIQNYLGIPIQLDFNGSSAITQNNQDGDPLIITDNTIRDIDPVASFERLYENIIPASDEVILNKETSNIDILLEDLPDQFVLDLSAVLLSEPESFATIPPLDEELFMALGGEAIIPLSGTFSNVEQVFDFDGVSEDIEDVDTVNIRIAYKSSIPIDLTGIIGFVSAENDTTFAQQQLVLEKNVEEAEFDTVTESEFSIASLALSVSEISSFLNASRITLTIVLNSPEGELTQLSIDQHLYFEIGIFAGLTVNI